MIFERTMRSICFAMSLAICVTGSSHPGRTDSRGGHKGPDGYHSHNGGSGSRNRITTPVAPRSTPTPIPMLLQSYVPTPIPEHNPLANTHIDHTPPQNGSMRIGKIHYSTKIFDRELMFAALKTSKITGDTTFVLHTPSCVYLKGRTEVVPIVADDYRIAVENDVSRSMPFCIDCFNVTTSPLVGDRFMISATGKHEDSIKSYRQPVSTPVAEPASIPLEVSRYLALERSGLVVKSESYQTVKSIKTVQVDPQMWNAMDFDLKKNCIAAMALYSSAITGKVAGDSIRSFEVIDNMTGEVLGGYSMWSGVYIGKN